ncbi:hypothetical protein TTHERM_000113178 (macronuclear) [Tetrahymena thermophila SB210]|uniref:Uncharacterized protein n=1 Tax=Tetrahymena thermophila (strain SB210) TaxID=312017 RepID=W7XDU2_TETTS|nr:hypothetical protein TTHERM_000113178 [Tetrahymena thermophila SB210]EWS75777.1 hypothetical protein TTHERM_000113178 [Tetrahymena thermophila SB210]|eukprot:XP_012651699.1 hypothetical protein TTHERM_000113178 [Tetrahymena thermophila SB210]
MVYYILNLIQLKRQVKDQSQKYNQIRLTKCKQKSLPYLKFQFLRNIYLKIYRIQQILQGYLLKRFST